MRMWCHGVMPSHHSLHCGCPTKVGEGKDEALHCRYKVNETRGGKGPRERESGIIALLWILDNPTSQQKAACFITYLS